MKEITDLQIGKAGEYLVCADLTIEGFIAYPSEQGLPYDLILDDGKKLLKVQVKTTRISKHIPQRKTSIPSYIFHIGNNGKKGSRNVYDKKDVDLFALVCLDTRSIAYISFFNHKTTMNFRVPELRGSYHDERSERIKKEVIELKNEGLSCQEIADKKGMKISNVYRYSADVSIKQKGTNSGVYFDEFKLIDALKNIK
jgi:hypothetical protein